MSTPDAAHSTVVVAACRQVTGVPSLAERVRTPSSQQKPRMTTTDEHQEGHGARCRTCGASNELRAGS
jgi:hypothetical protein